MSSFSEFCIGGSCLEKYAQVEYQITIEQYDDCEYEFYYIELNACRACAKNKTFNGDKIVQTVPLQELENHVPAAPFEYLEEDFPALPSQIPASEDLIIFSPPSPTEVPLPPSLPETPEIPEPIEIDSDPEEELETAPRLDKGKGKEVLEEEPMYESETLDWINNLTEEEFQQYLNSLITSQEHAYDSDPNSESDESISGLDILSRTTTEEPIEGTPLVKILPKPLFITLTPPTPGSTPHSSPKRAPDASLLTSLPYTPKNKNTKKESKEEKPRIMASSTRICEIYLYPYLSKNHYLHRLRTTRSYQEGMPIWFQN